MKIYSFEHVVVVVFVHKYPQKEEEEREAQNYRWAALKSDLLKLQKSKAFKLTWLLYWVANKLSCYMNFFYFPGTIKTNMNYINDFRNSWDVTFYLSLMKLIPFYVYFMIHLSFLLLLLSSSKIYNSNSIVCCRFIIVLV